VRDGKETVTISIDGQLINNSKFQRASGATFLLNNRRVTRK